MDCSVLEDLPEDQEEEEKYCYNCCFFHGMFDDLLHGEGWGWCQFQTWDEPMNKMDNEECYYPAKYERCFG